MKLNRIRTFSILIVAVVSISMLALIHHRNQVVRRDAVTAESCLRKHLGRPSLHRASFVTDSFGTSTRATFRQSKLDQAAVERQVLIIQGNCVSIEKITIDQQ